VNAYAESSAVLSWLMDEPAGTSVRAILADAEIVVASDLTLIECDRVLLRARLLGELSEVEADDAIHLASALVARSAIAGLQLLSLDSRIRTAGEKIGFGVLPAGAA